MDYLNKFIKRIKTWWFEWQLRLHYRPDTYVYEDEENFENYRRKSGFKK